MVSRSSATQVAPGPTIDATTVFSLLSTVAILGAAYFASLKVLQPDTKLKLRILFVWHMFDGLIHTFLEGGFLVNCFFTYVDLPKGFNTKGASSSAGGFWGRGAATPLSAAEEAARKLLQFTPPGVFWLGDQDRLYGSSYGANPLALLWQEYAKADRRWGGTDLTVISLELLTVFIGAPLALYVCWLIVQGETSKRGAVVYKKWFWMIVLATGELYGGFMTFAPEWLSGNPNLDGSNWMYYWVYLMFFNLLWVFFPLWAIYESYQAITGAMTHEQVVDIIANLPKKGN